MEANKISRNRFIVALSFLFIVLLVCVVCLVMGNSSTQDTDNVDSALPSYEVTITEEDYQQKELEEKKNAEVMLKEAREKSISDILVNELGEGSPVWGVSVKGIDVDFELDFGSHQMKSASIIKPFIAAAYFANRETLSASGVDVLNGDRLIDKMISASDNSATNTLIDYCSGFDVVNDYCKTSGYSDTHLGRYMLGSNALDDNFTSVRDCAALLSEIYTGGVPGSEQILNAMFAQQRRSKIPAGITDGAKVANKTGEISGVENDIAIIEGTHKYILCIMSDTGNSSSAIGEIVSLTKQINEEVQGF